MYRHTFVNKAIYKWHFVLCYRNSKKTQMYSRSLLNRIENRMWPHTLNLHSPCLHFEQSANPYHCSLALPVRDVGLLWRRQETSLIDPTECPATQNVIKVKCLIAGYCVGIYLYPNYKIDLNCIFQEQSIFVYNVRLWTLRDVFSRPSCVS